MIRKPNNKSQINYWHVISHGIDNTITKITEAKRPNLKSKDKDSNCQL